MCRKEGMEIAELDDEGVEGVKKKIMKEKDGYYEFARKDEEEGDPRCENFLVHHLKTIEKEMICSKPLDIYTVICTPVKTNSSGLEAKTPVEAPEMSQARLIGIVAGVIGAFFGGIGLACVFFWCFAPANLRVSKIIRAFV